MPHFPVVHVHTVFLKYPTPIVEFVPTGRATAKGLVLLLVISMCPPISAAPGYISQPRSRQQSAAVLDAQWHVVAISFHAAVLQPSLTFAPRRNTTHRK
jgi:hypothetical protein